MIWQWVLTQTRTLDSFSEILNLTWDYFFHDCNIAHPTEVLFCLLLLQTRSSLCWATWRRPCPQMKSSTWYGWPTPCFCSRGFTSTRTSCSSWRSTSKQRWRRWTSANQQPWRIASTLGCWTTRRVSHLSSLRKEYIKTGCKTGWNGLTNKVCILVLISFLLT